MSWIRIWIHLVFSTKNREAYFIKKEIKEKARALAPFMELCKIFASKIKTWG